MAWYSPWSTWGDAAVVVTGDCTYWKKVGLLLGEELQVGRYVLAAVYWVSNQLYVSCQ